MEKGISLYLAVVILAILTSTVLGLVVLLTDQIKIFSSLGDSVIAFYAADAGVEHSLYNFRRGENPNVQNTPGELSYGVQEATYTVEKKGSIITSQGTYKETTRAIEISY